MSTQKLMTSILAATILFVMAPKVNASECTTQYGGTTTCVPLDLTINKQVQDPITGVYVENVTTPKFNQGDNVNFELIVSNTSGQMFTGVKVTDTVPENVEIVDASVNFTNSRVEAEEYKISTDKKSVEFHVDELSAGKTVEVYIMAKLVGTYPTEDSFCRDNWANVKASERGEGDKNFARFCVTNKVGAAKQLPVAGVEDLVFMIPFIATGLGGLALIRKNK